MLANSGIWHKSLRPGDFRPPSSNLPLMSPNPLTFCPVLNLTNLTTSAGSLFAVHLGYSTPFTVVAWKYRATHTDGTVHPISLDMPLGYQCQQRIMRIRLGQVLKRESFSPFWKCQEIDFPCLPTLPVCFYRLQIGHRKQMQCGKEREKRIKQTNCKHFELFDVLQEVCQPSSSQQAGSSHQSLCPSMEIYN